MPTLAPGPRLIDLGNPVASHPLNRDRKAWWYGLPTFGFGGRLSDLTGRNHLTTVAGTPWRPEASARPYGSVIELNGSSQWATGSTVYPFATDATGAMAAWVRTTTVGADQVAIGFGQTAVTTDLTNFGIDGAGVWRFESRQAGAFTIVATATAPVANAWIRALFVMTAAGGRFFVNGIEKTLTFTTGTSTTVKWASDTVPTGARMGAKAQSGTARPWSGQLADGSIWGPSSWACFDPVGFAWADYDESRRGYPAAIRRYTPRTWVFGGQQAGGSVYPWWNDAIVAGAMSGPIPGANIFGAAGVLVG